MSDLWKDLNECKAVKLHLIEGEIIVGLTDVNDQLFVRTNLGRYFVSTKAPIENLEFVEVTE